MYWTSLVTDVSKVLCSFIFKVTLFEPADPEREETGASKRR